jgi:hypothetical protein
MLNIASNSISIISWESMFFVEDTGVPGETTDLSWVIDTEVPGKTPTCHKSLTNLITESCIGCTPLLFHLATVLSVLFHLATVLSVLFHLATVLSVLFHLATVLSATRKPLQGGLSCSGRVSSSCFTDNTRRVTLVTNLVIFHERGKDREVFTTSGTYLFSFVTQIFHNGQPSHGVEYAPYVRSTWFHPGF